MLVAYGVWSVTFIFRTSAIDLDGVRHWVLFDDAMISMRYALNLVSGRGLTWNPGEYVEGFTNPLWTAVMSLAILLFGKGGALLFIQLTGMCLVIGSCLLFKKAADEMLGRASIFPVLATAVVLLYYPLSYWSLVGMEVSALALCMAGSLYVAICKPDAKHSMIDVFAILSLAFLIRPDGFLALTPVVAVLLLQSRPHDDSGFLRGQLLKGAALFATIIVVLFCGRLIYYGELWPNSYVLKMTGYDVGWRAANGLGFIYPFLLVTSPLWLLGVFAVGVSRGSSRLINWSLLLMPSIAVLYQIYVGGDPWDYWRHLTPAIMPLVLLGFVGLKRLTDRAGRFTPAIAVAVACLVVVAQNWKFRYQIVQGKPHGFTASDSLVKTSDLLNDIAPNGSVLVFWGGTLPYLHGGYAIDAFGKSDKYIATLAPDPNVAWGRMRGVPGHAKHSLAYSLNEKEPDFVQHFRWFGDDVSGFVDRKYVAIKYRERFVCLKANSRNVRWELVEVVGKCTEYESHMSIDPS